MEKIKKYLIAVISVIAIILSISVSAAIDSGPKYTRGDIAQEDHPFGDRIVIIGYNETEDKYTVASVYLMTVSWRYDGTSSIEDKETIEKFYPILVAHVNSLTEIRDLGIVRDTSVESQKTEIPGFATIAVITGFVAAIFSIRRKRDS